ncbi:type II toxin-antitoxin system VapC family toxin [Nostoc sp. CENA543]|uniref:type II toxin-antitoxin system VapC family toxin n=1 Tax=Nostoc sp. CENA543 TaxID=1869241 RepID=UPI001CEF6C58|nr:type II toxin-antitoxin system VapC family toxin [Nostoc sp. CENA543]
MKAELFYGAGKSKNPQRSLALQLAFLNRFISLPFNDVAANVSGGIRAELAMLGTPTEPYDLQ